MKLSVVIISSILFISFSVNALETQECNSNNCFTYDTQTRQSYNYRPNISPSDRVKRQNLQYYDNRSTRSPIVTQEALDELFKALDEVEKR